MSVIGILEFLYVAGPTLIFAIVASIVPHEGAHWIVARAFSDDIALKRDGFEPNVQLYDPYSVPAWGIRLIGAAPTILGGSIALAAFYTFAPITATDPAGVFWATLGIATMAGSVFSGGDILAVFAPSEFQEFAADSTYESPGFVEALGMISG